MQTYSAYKDSGVEWLGEIPEGWEVKRFRNMFSFSKGLTITKENLQETGIPCLNYGEVHSKYGFEIDPKKHVLKCVKNDYLASNPKSLLSIGNFVFADTSEDIEGSGNFTQLVSDEIVFAGYHTIITKPIGDNNFRYLAYVLDSVSFRNQIRNTVKGVKVFSITKTILKNTSIWLPSNLEQTAIARFLDNKVGKIERLLAIKQQQIDLLKERQQILIQNAVTQGLNPNAPKKDSGIDWIGEIPVHWEISKIGHYANVTNGSTPSRDTPRYWQNGSIPWLTSGKVNDFEISTPSELISDSAFRECSLKMYPKGTVIIGIVGQGKTRGTSALLKIDATINQNVAGIVSGQNIMPKFLHKYLIQAYETIRNYGKGSNQEALNCSIVSAIKIVVLPLHEQDHIVNFIENNSKKINTAIQIKQQQIEKLNEYKTTLINAAVTGKIKVPEVTAKEASNEP